jgi:hypothetical protein
MLKTVGNPSTRYGDQTIVDGNLVIGTAGKGIDFSADPAAPGMTSELLDDYEEGTFTPTLTRSSSAPTLTYTQQRGYYTKIGNVVHCDIAVAWSANSGGSGYWYLASLPFTNKSATEHYPAAAMGGLDGFTSAVGTTQFSLQIVPNQTFGVFGCFGSAVASNVIYTVAASGSVYLSVTYIAA